MRPNESRNSALRLSAKDRGVSHGKLKAWSGDKRERWSVSSSSDILDIDNLTLWHLIWLEWMLVTSSITETVGDDLDNC